MDEGPLDRGPSSLACEFSAIGRISPEQTTFVLSQPESGLTNRTSGIILNYQNKNTEKTIVYKHHAVSRRQLAEAGLTLSFNINMTWEVAMYRSTILSVFLILFVSFLSAPLLGQDAGTPDTLRFTTDHSWTIDSDADSMFSIELWGWIDDPAVKACSFGFVLNTGFSPDVDSFVIVDTFVFDPGMTASVQTYSRSLLWEDYDPDAAGWGYNGFAVGLVDFVNTILPTNTSVKIGDLHLKIIDREQVPANWVLEVDSAWFPPAGVFKYSPSGGQGYPPQFVKSEIQIDNDITPKILSVSPDVGKQGETLGVEITGYRANFGQGSETNVYLSKGTETINGYGTLISSATFLTTNFNIPSDAETGDWDVSVFVTGYGTLTLDNGFAINPPYICGDANASGRVDIGDIVFIVSFIFSQGPEPIPYESGDVNCDGTVDIDDVVFLINYIFAGWHVPCDIDGDNIPDC